MDLTLYPITFFTEYEGIQYSILKYECFIEMIFIKRSQVTLSLEDHQW
jgi:hypothetical protein